MYIYIYIYIDMNHGPEVREGMSEPSIPILIARSALTMTLRLILKRSFGEVVPGLRLILLARHLW